MKIDRIDTEILIHLQNEGRLSNAKLASQLSISETPCWRRLKRLEEAGIIEGYQAVLNRRKLGLGVLAFVQLTCTEHSEEVTAKFQQTIKTIPNILTCHNTTGDSDFLLHVVAKDLDDYSRFIEKVIRKLPGVTNINSSLSLRELKSSNQLPVEKSF